MNKELKPLFTKKAISEFRVHFCVHFINIPYPVLFWVTREIGFFRGNQNKIVRKGST